MKSILFLLSTCAVALSAVAGETNGPAPAEDRVGFPKDYAKTYEALRTISREEGKKVVTVYGNALAASITNRMQLPYPNGSVLVMETASTLRDSDGKPLTGSTGGPQKEKVLGLHVMRRGKGFGAAYESKRSGEWEFVEYRLDGSYITPPQKSASCAECHIKAGAEKDFVYKGRLADAEKK
jgi:hypothetical protein